MQAKSFRGLPRSKLGITSVALAAALAAAVYAGTTVASNDAASGAQAATPAWVATAAKYVGATKLGKADATKPPITIGLVNNQGGIPAAPEASLAAQAAVKLINKRLGGIQGYPLGLKICVVVSSEEQGQKCAQQFLADPSVKVISTGLAAIGSTSMHATIDGKKPVIAAGPNNPAQATAKNTWHMTSGVFGSSPGFVAYAIKFLKAKHVASLYAGDNPAAVVAEQVLKAALDAKGVKHTTAPYSSTASDLLAPLTASGAAQADALVLFVSNPPSCVAVEKGIRQLGIKAEILGLGFCAIGAVKDQLGDYPKWNYVFWTDNPEATPIKNPQVESYLKAMTTYVGKNAEVGYWAPLTYSAIMTAARILNAVGPTKATPDAIAAKASAFKGPGWMAPAYKFGSVQGLSALGTLATRFYHYKGNGKWEDATKGEWVTP